MVVEGAQNSLYFFKYLTLFSTEQNKDDFPPTMVVDDVTEFF